VSATAPDAAAAPAPGGAVPGPVGDGTVPGTVLPLSGRTAVLIAVTSLVGLAGFCWPLLASPTGDAVTAHAGDAPWLFVLLVPLLLAVVVSDMADGGLDARSVALLGVLAACGSALRLAGTGVSGFEAVFFLLIPAGRVYGRAFGFVLGALTLFASALLTGGVGPWLPFQMLGAAWIGFGAGCLPRARGRAEVGLLAGYAVVIGLAYGLLLNLWFWPFTVGGESSLAFVAGDPLVENLRRFWAFHLATSLGWDLPRAAVNCLLMVLAGPGILLALRRAGRRAAFGAAVAFGPVPVSAPPDPAPGGEGRG
jgi:energy-coupling factor transport system substrate-specific component